MSLERTEGSATCLYLLSRVIEMLKTWWVSLCSITSFKRLPLDGHLTLRLMLAAILGGAKDDCPSVRIIQSLLECQRHQCCHTHWKCTLTYAKPCEPLELAVHTSQFASTAHGFKSIPVEASKPPFRSTLHPTGPWGPDRRALKDVLTRQ